MLKLVKFLVFFFLFLIILFIFILPIFSAERTANKPPSIAPDFNPEKLQEYHKTRLIKEKQELEKALEYYEKELKKEQENNRLKKTFSRIFCQRFSKDESIAHWTIVSFEAVIVNKDGIEVSFPFTENNEMLQGKWTVKDFNRCANVLKRQYKDLPQDQTKTIVIKGIFSRFPDVKVKFPYEEILKNKVILLRNLLKGNKKQERSLIVSN